MLPEKYGVSLEVSINYPLNHCDPHRYRSMAYSYTPMADENSIRLLHLEPGSDGTPLKASLSIHDLDRQFSYDALSYVWGTPDLNKSHSINEQELRITHNLHIILCYLRYPERVRILWIDAICINQQDGTEKGPQV